MLDIVKIMANTYEEDIIGYNKREMYGGWHVIFIDIKGLKENY